MRDSRGIVSDGRPNLTSVKADLAGRTDPRRIHRTAADALYGADVFIGVSSGTVDEALLATMALPRP
ncbi:malic enzyme [Arthrobacter sp. UYP6]